MIYKPPPKTHPWKHIAKLGDMLFDPSIVFSFDQSGYNRHRVQFDPEDLSVDMTNRVCLVTGANSGLGLATATALAARNATVWMLCRNLPKANAAAENIRNQTGNHNIVVSALDLTCRESIKSFSKRFASNKVDVLIHNAGVLLNARQTTPMGEESTLATNLLGPLILTGELLEKLRNGHRSRVIWVSSGGMYTQRLNIGRLKDPPNPFNGVTAYAQTKRAMAVLSRQLAEKLKEQGIAVHCMHPGWADTPGVENSIPTFWKLTKPILRTPEAGSDTIVWLAVCDKSHHQTGLYWFDRKPRATHLLPGTKTRDDVEETLWKKIHQWALLAPTIWEKT